ncbi:MAG: hypothetical protein KAH08_08845, partial [Methylococcales bacterium]|nr:hypothetical protein [Methylococcales bacterium]
NPNAHAEKISLALPRAIKESDPLLLREALDEALQETVEACLIESVHKEPALYVDALYPVILPMIKKSISESFKDVMQSLNLAIEEGLSINRFSWHYQAWRAGIPYREMVLRNTLAYRVEQAFLIDRETGLLLRHVSIDGIDELRDSDAISAMLTAIQDFTQDSFSANENDQLNTVEVGDYTVFLNRGTYAMLACVIQGIPPYQLRAQFDGILGDIHQHHTDLLKNFEGDSAPLAVIDVELTQCLLSERKNITEKTASVSGAYIFIPLFLILLLVGYWAYDQWKFEQRRLDYLSLLQQYEGVVVTDNTMKGDKLMIKGLYDPLIVNPSEILKRSRLHTDEVVTDWQPYHSLSPAIVILRLRKVLQIPSHAQVDLNGTTLTFSGVAKKSWIKKIMQITPVLTGITHVNIDKLKNYDQSITQHLQPPTTTNFSYEDGRLQLNGVAPLRWHQQATKKIAALKFVNQVQWSTLEITEAIKLQQLKERVEKQAIYFTKSVAITVKADVLQTLIDEINEMLTLSQQLNKTMILTITGYTDGVDSTEYNTALATTRAQKMVELLKKSLPLVNMKTAVQLSSTKRSNKLQRKVSFMISFNKESSIK